jgi:hypothetical protein
MPKNEFLELHTTQEGTFGDLKWISLTPIKESKPIKHNVDHTNWIQKKLVTTKQLCFEISNHQKWFEITQLEMIFQH